MSQSAQCTKEGISHNRAVLSNFEQELSPKNEIFNSSDDEERGIRMSISSKNEKPFVPLRVAPLRFVGSPSPASSTTPKLPLRRSSISTSESKLLPSTRNRIISFSVSKSPSKIKTRPRGKQIHPIPEGVDLQRSLRPPRVFHVSLSGSENLPLFRRSLSKCEADILSFAGIGPRKGKSLSVDEKKVRRGSAAAARTSIFSYDTPLNIVYKHAIVVSSRRHSNFYSLATLGRSTDLVREQAQQIRKDFDLGWEMLSPRVVRKVETICSNGLFSPFATANGVVRMDSPEKLAGNLLRNLNIHHLRSLKAPSYAKQQSAYKARKRRRSFTFGTRVESYEQSIPVERNVEKGRRSVSQVRQSLKELLFILNELSLNTGFTKLHCCCPLSGCPLMTLRMLLMSKQLINCTRAADAECKSLAIKILGRASLISALLPRCKRMTSLANLGVLEGKNLRSIVDVMVKSSDIQTDGMVNSLTQLMCGRTPQLEPTPTIDLFTAQVIVPSLLPALVRCIRRASLNMEVQATQMRNLYALVVNQSSLINPLEMMFATIGLRDTLYEMLLYAWETRNSPFNSNKSINSSKTASSNASLASSQGGDSQTSSIISPNDSLNDKASTTNSAPSLVTLNSSSSLLSISTSNTSISSSRVVLNLKKSRRKRTKIRFRTLPRRLHANTESKGISRRTSLDLKSSNESLNSLSCVAGASAPRDTVAQYCIQIETGLSTWAFKHRNRYEFTEFLRQSMGILPCMFGDDSDCVARIVMLSCFKKLLREPLRILRMRAGTEHWVKLAIWLAYFLQYLLYGVSSSSNISLKGSLRPAATASEMTLDRKNLFLCSKLITGVGLQIPFQDAAYGERDGPERLLRGLHETGWLIIELTKVYRACSTPDILKEKVSSVLNEKRSMRSICFLRAIIPASQILATKNQKPQCIIQGTLKRLRPIPSKPMWFLLTTEKLLGDSRISNLKSGIANYDIMLKDIVRVLPVSDESHEVKFHEHEDEMENGKEIRSPRCTSVFKIDTGKFTLMVAAGSQKRRRDWIHYLSLTISQARGVNVTGKNWDKFQVATKLQESQFQSLRSVRRLQTLGLSSRRYNPDLDRKGRSAPASKISLQGDTSSDTEDYKSFQKRNRCNLCSKNFGLLKRKMRCSTCDVLMCKSCSRSSPLSTTKTNDLNTKKNIKEIGTRQCAECFWEDRRITSQKTADQLGDHIGATENQLYRRLKVFGNALAYSVVQENKHISKSLLWESILFASEVEMRKNNKIRLLVLTKKAMYVFKPTGSKPCRLRVAFTNIKKTKLIYVDNQTIDLPYVSVQVRDRKNVEFLIGCPSQVVHALHLLSNAAASRKGCMTMSAASLMAAM